jgi:hypothetical protein
MVERKTRKPLFERLKQGLNEGIAWSKEVPAVQEIGRKGLVVRRPVTRRNAKN